MGSLRVPGAEVYLSALLLAGVSACNLLEDIVADSEPPVGTGGSASGGAAGVGAPTGGNGATTSAGGAGLGGSPVAGGPPSGAAGLGGMAGAPVVAGAGGSAGDAGAGGAAGAAGVAGFSGMGGGASGAAGAGPSDPPCRLEPRAFCDPMTVAAPGGRSGDLDETRWYSARFAQTVNASSSSGPFVGWFPVQVPDCSGAPVTLGVGSDLIVCAGGARVGLRDALHLDAEYNREVDRTLSVRQPFDFQGRVGRIAFDLASESPIDTAEIWLTSNPLTGLGRSVAFPSLALRVRISRTGCSGNRARLTVTASSAELVTELSPAVDPGCFETGTGAAVHYEIRVARDHVEVWWMPPGMLELAELARFAGSIAFSRAYLHFVHGRVISDSEDGFEAVREVRWSNVGFDGPVRDSGRSYDVADSLVPATGETIPPGYVSIGYQVQPDRVTNVSVDGVDLSGQPLAYFSFDLFGQPSSDAPLTMQWNGNPARYYNVSGPTAPWRAVSLTVPVSQLVAGTNGLALSARGPALVVANLRLSILQAEAGLE